MERKLQITILAISLFVQSCFSQVSAGSRSIGMFANVKARSPSSFPGLKIWLDANVGVYSDAGATPAVNGGTVYQWNDLSGNGKNFTRPAAGYEPYYTNWSAMGSRYGIIGGFVSSLALGLRSPSGVGLYPPYTIAFTIFWATNIGIQEMYFCQTAGTPYIHGGGGGPLYVVCTGTGSTTFTPASNSWNYVIWSNHDVGLRGLRNDYLLSNAQRVSPFKSITGIGTNSINQLEVLRRLSTSCGEAMGEFVAINGMLKKDELEGLEFYFKQKYNIGTLTP